MVVGDYVKLKSGDMVHIHTAPAGYSRFTNYYAGTVLRTNGTIGRQFTFESRAFVRYLTTAEEVAMKLRGL